MGGDLIEGVKLIDLYQDKRNMRESRCYRIYYRSFERTLENSEIDEIQQELRKSLADNLSLRLR